MSKCNGCIYWRRFCGNGTKALNACHYILDTEKCGAVIPINAQKRKRLKPGRYTHE